MITLEWLNEQKKSLEHQRGELTAQLNTVNGAYLMCDALIKKFQEDEPQENEVSNEGESKE